MIEEKGVRERYSSWILLLIGFLLTLLLSALWTKIEKKSVNRIV